MITKTDTTAQALQKCLNLLKKGGLGIVVAYCGHEGGQEEKNCVDNLLQMLPAKSYDVWKLESHNRAIIRRFYICSDAKMKNGQCACFDNVFRGRCGRICLIPERVKGVEEKMGRQTYQMTELGYALKEYRVRNNMTQTELARDIGVSANTIHLWETRCCRPAMSRLSFCRIAGRAACGDYRDGASDL